MICSAWVESGNSKEIMLSSVVGGGVGEISWSCKCLIRLPGNLKLATQRIGNAYNTAPPRGHGVAPDAPA